MAKRKEPRARLSLEVRVLGMDTDGRVIVAPAQTVNISRHGVVIENLAARLRPGEVVSLQYKGRKVRYRVIWAGDEGTARAGQMGLQTVKMQDDLWREDLPNLDSSPDIRPRRGERREQRRYEGCLAIEVRAGNDKPIWGEISDISLSGCYMKTLFPVAADSDVSLVLWLGEKKIAVRGKVRTCLQGVGCGIEFQHLSPQHQQELKAFCQASCVPSSDRRARPAHQAARKSEIEPAASASSPSPVGESR